MRYCWGDYDFDRTGSLLTQMGQPVDVTRKVLDCINHLLANRQRVVGYDELIIAVWAHENVTNHQLAQVVLAARRAIGDDGAAQRLIRTASGLGYQWVGAVTEATITEAAPQGQAPEASSPTQMSESAPAPDMSHPAQAMALMFRPSAARPSAAAHVWYRSGQFGIAVALALALVAAAFFGLQQRKSEPAAAAPPPVSAKTADPLPQLREALWQGKFEEVREGLARLPANLVGTPYARILEINLDVMRGRYATADKKLTSEQARAALAKNPVWQADLLTLRSVLNTFKDAPPADILAPAQSAVALLEAAGDGVAPKALADALKTRGRAFIRNNRFEEALRDLARAGDLYHSIGDMHGVNEVRTKRARVWLLTGKLQEALDELSTFAETSRRSGVSIDEIFTLNVMTRIQLELLRRDDAIATNDRSMQLLREVPNVDRRYRTLQLRAQVLSNKGQLRQAGSLLDESEHLQNEVKGFSSIPALYQLESDNPAAALEAAAKAFDLKKDDQSVDILLDSKDGTLLVWITAAQALSAGGGPIPTPSAAQLKILAHPQTVDARIARGRWLWSQGKPQEAEAELRLALMQARQLNQLYHMTLAAEPLIELLLRRGDSAAAKTAFADLRAYDPEHVDQDYRTSLLGLRIALAFGDDASIIAANRSARALAGERRLPTEIVNAYKKRGL